MERPSAAHITTIGAAKLAGIGRSVVAFAGSSIIRSPVRPFQSQGYSAVAFASAEEYLLTALFSLTSCQIVDLQLPATSGADLKVN